MVTNQCEIQRPVCCSVGLNLLQYIAVPSRLYCEKSDAKPLAGLRFAVKDVIDVAGLETGCGNRSYRALYPPAKASAPFISHLLQLGAILVGKTDSAQFGDGLDPSERYSTLSLREVYRL